jgi:hypothetical protein
MESLTVTSGQTERGDQASRAVDEIAQDGEGLRPEPDLLIGPPEALVCEIEAVWRERDFQASPSSAPRGRIIRDLHRD